MRIKSISLCLVLILSGLFFLGLIGVNTGASASFAAEAQYKTDNSTFDPKATDAKGRTNEERMKKGLAPIGRDSEPVQIHHQGQSNTGTRVETLATEHRKIPHDTTKKSEIDRKEFSKERAQHWKERGKELSGKGGKKK